MIVKNDAGTKRFCLYAFRWQLSSLILAPVVYLIENPLLAVVVGNLIGAIVFYNIDKRILHFGKQE